MHFAYPVRNARIEEDPFCRCRLSGVDVRHDSDISAAVQWCGARHGIHSLRALKARG
jgi:hypothetical protein